MTLTENRPSYGIAPPNGALPGETRIGAVRLQVASLERSLRYYSEVLGMQVLSREDGHAALAAQRSETPLVHLVERAGARAVPRQGRLGLYHFAILLPDRASLGRFIVHLADNGIYAGMSDHFVSEAVYLTDPDGLGIEVYADRPRARWRTRGAELEMTTEPLDVRDLVDAAGDTPWSGMPAGTSIGHVHLHVGDLAAAEDFYHHGIGFDKTVWSYPGALFLAAGGYHHHLGTNTWASRAPRAEPEDAQLLDWEIVLPGAEDVEQVRRRLTDAGHNVMPSDDAHVVADPWGTTVRLRT